MRKRLLTALLALCIALALAAPALAANSDFVIENGVLTKYTGPGGNVVIPNGVTSIGDWAFKNCLDLTSVTIPNSVTSIGDFAFDECISLTSVTIPNSVTSIGGEAFHSCHSLTSVTIPNSVTSIGDAAFAGCDSLTSVTIPNSVTRIGEELFRWCDSLTRVTIPNSVTSIGEAAFWNCTSLTAIQVDASNPKYCSVDGVLFSKDMKTLVVYPGGKRGAYNIPSGVTSIGDYAFDYCTSLTGVTIPGSVTSIGECAFIYCTGLTSVTIPNSVTSIRRRVFDCCTSLTSVTIPNSVTSIGDDAFWACTSLTGVTIPNSVTSIGGEAFGCCTSLTSATIPNSVTSIGERAFAYCTSLTDVYYGGTEAQWKRIKFGADNAPMLSAAIHYNSTVGKEYYVSCNGGKVNFTESLEDCIAKKQSSGDYNPELAHMLIAMCNSVYSSADMAETFDSFGFSYKQPRYEEEFITYSVAKKYMPDGTPLVLVVAKGTGPLPWEENSDTPGWGSNVWGYMAPRGDYHSGYADAADEIYGSIEDILKDDAGNLSKAKFVLTGFSRGAATANLLARKLNDVKVAQSHIYAYTFACPDTTRSKYYSKMDCIFNINDASDVVSWMPNGAFGGMYSEWNKFGRSYWFSNEWDSIDLEMGSGAHNQTKYLEYLGERIRYEKGTSEFKKRDEAKNFLDNAADRRDEQFWIRLVDEAYQQIGNVEIKCPVDVEIYASGKLVGSVTNELAKVIDPEKVFISVAEGRKEIYLLDDAAYTFNLTATGEGTMTYTVKNVDVATRNAVAEQVFESVALSSDKQFTSKVTTKENAVVGVDEAEIDLYVLDAAGKPEKEVLPDGKGTEVPYEPKPAQIPFDDVEAGQWYYDAVYWAVQNGVTNGTGPAAFSPNQDCTEIQILTFLWRAAGKPAADAVLPVTVTGVADYVSAAKWAFSKGMIDGTFKQDTPCTRARAVMLMWQAAGSPAASGGGFADVPANAAYAQAVAWAVGEGVTNGTGRNMFSPGGICSRGHIVTFLYRDRG